ncbi:hypothetical protein [Thermostaphylospora chromogena]|uniref:hypothetical protein n=1 Tax=Thermostaphylospora chromogena TaxID=35622 RepID=UPI00104271A6|nr:hypothetical protein [Thermostaphylospora chromogena]
MTGVKPWGVAATALLFTLACTPAVSQSSGEPAARAAGGGTATGAREHPRPGPGRRGGPQKGAPVKPEVPPGTTAGYVVFDRKANKTLLHHNATRRFRSASVIKILIAYDFLESAERVSTADAAKIAAMLRSSDDDAASEFWRRGGRKKIVQRMARKIGLRHTTPPPDHKPGFWGYSSLSAQDVVRTYRYLLHGADRKIADVILGHLRKATKCGSDGFDQSFGIPSAVPRPWAVKQGWSGFGTTPPARCADDASGAAAAPPPAGQGAPASTNTDTTTIAAADGAVPDLGRPVLHTTGLVGGDDRFIMVVLTAHPAGSSWASSVERTTALTERLYRAAAG